MKKIMFNERYGLQQAVLEGRKTMTRRVVKGYFEDVKAIHANGEWHFIADTRDGDSVEIRPHYEEGETVAVGQRYGDIAWHTNQHAPADLRTEMERLQEEKGWVNKIYVRPELMPHRIRITSVRFERLQDISDEDAMKEGVCENDELEIDKFTPWPLTLKPYKYNLDNEKAFCAPRYAFGHLIRKVCGSRTWNENPWVAVYEFKLVE
jgi:uncharacterized protein YhfF